MTKQTDKPLMDDFDGMPDRWPIRAGEVTTFQGQRLTRREWWMIHAAWRDALKWARTFRAAWPGKDVGDQIGAVEFARRYGPEPTDTAPTLDEPDINDIAVLWDRTRARPSEQFREFADDVIPDEFARDRSMFYVCRAPRRWLAEMIAVSKRQEELFEEWHGFREYNLRVVQRLQLAIGERVIAERGIPSPDTRGSAR